MNGSLKSALTQPFNSLANFITQNNFVFLDHQAANTDKESFDSFVKKFEGEVFLQEGGSTFIILKKTFIGAHSVEKTFLKHNTFLGSLDSSFAFQLCSKRSLGADNDSSTQFENGSRIERSVNKIRFFSIDKNVLELSLVESVRAEIITNAIKFKANPESYKADFLAELPNGDYVYISSPRDGEMGDVRVILGTPEQIREIDILTVKDTHSQKSTIIESEFGQIFLPQHASEANQARVLFKSGHTVHLTLLDLSRKSSTMIIKSLELGISCNLSRAVCKPPNP
jgi:hypothetical protein